MRGPQHLDSQSHTVTTISLLNIEGTLFVPLRCAPERATEVVSRQKTYLHSQVGDKTMGPYNAFDGSCSASDGCGFGRMALQRNEDTFTEKTEVSKVMRDGLTLEGTSKSRNGTPLLLV